MKNVILLIGFFCTLACASASPTFQSAQENNKIRRPASGDGCNGKLPWPLDGHYEKATGAWCLHGQDGMSHLMDLFKEIRERKAEWFGGNMFLGAEEFTALALTGYKLDILMVYTTSEGKMVDLLFSALDKSRPVNKAAVTYKAPTLFGEVVKKQ